MSKRKPAKTSRRNKVSKRRLRHAPAHAVRHSKAFITKSLWHRLAAGLLALSLVVLGSMYGMARAYMTRHVDEPFKVGATFIPDYAHALGVDPEQTLDAMLNDLGIRNLRLVSYWKNGEKVEGKYDFSFLDWQFAKANAAGAKVSLAIGLRQPRWPECHLPDWAENYPKSIWEPKLKNYMKATIERYRDNPALESYQLENEYFLKAFGICPDFSRDRLVSEYDLVKSLDSKHTLIVSMSNNAIGTPIGEPTPDKWAISIYKRVWDKTLTKRYFEYPIPAWYYGFRAGWVELTRGHDSFIHELQAEAWAPEGFDMQTASTEELYKSLNPERLRDRFHYGEATGMRKMDLWGAEWWYAMKIKRGQPELWNVAREEYKRLTPRR